MDQLLDRAAIFYAGGLAAKFHRHVHLDQFIDRDASEIDVQDVRAVGIPLQIANKGRFVDRARQTDQAAAVAECCCKRVGRDRQADVRLSVTIQYGRGLARIT